MATKKKMLQAAAGNAGEALNVEDVFSTYLYTGNSSTQTITNGIDLDGEGGLVWIKAREQARFHSLNDTERGAGIRLNSSATSAEQDVSTSGVTSFTSTGFTLGFNTIENENGWGIASWTFRKAPKFFDVVTYTGTGSVQNISHNLGAVPGAIIIKKTSAVSTWPVWHRSIYALSTSGRILLNESSAYGNSGATFNSTEPTDSVFTVGTSPDTNASGNTYVAYLFAHNDGDGEFGPDGDADIIKCGSYTGNGSNDGPEIDLGFEPQWLMVKAASASGDWKLYDSMRGLNASGASDYFLEPNTTDIEDLGNYYAVTPTGFKLTDNTFFHNSSGETYIYIAIRRGTKVPESGTDVAHVGQQSTGTGSATSLSLDTGFPVDFLLNTLHISGYTTPRHTIVDRLRGFTGTSSKKLITHLTNAEGNAGTTLTGVKGDSNSGIYNAGNVNSVYSGNTSLALKRAPNFFDVVAYTGNGASGRTVSHNLGVAPEMVWVKARNASVYSWIVQGTAIEAGKRLELNETYALSTTFGGVSNLTSTSFDLGNWNNVNGNTTTYIAYLFASLPGISKVGSYTGNGTSQTIDCGFTSGAQFVLIKRTDATGDWVEFDTNKGIVAGNDPFVILNSDADKSGVNADHIDPDNSGFIVNQDATTNINVSGGSYIFYAIA